MDIFSIAAIKVKNRWHFGDIEEIYEKNGFNCDEEIANLKNIDSSYFRCNPNYFQCYFSGKAGQKDPTILVNLGGKKYHVFLNREFKDFYNNEENSRFYKFEVT